MSYWPDVQPRLYDSSEGVSNAENWYRQTGVPILKTSAVWSAANLAVYTPILLVRATKIGSIHLFNGAAVSGNICLGLYLPDAEGKPGDRLATTGSAAQSGTDGAQSPALTDFWAPAGLCYLACAIDNTTAQVQRIAALTTNGQGAAMGGIFTEAAAFPLPATATPSAAGVTAAVPLLACRVGLS